MKRRAATLHFWSLVVLMGAVMFLDSCSRPKIPGGSSSLSSTSNFHITNSITTNCASCHDSGKSFDGYAWSGISTSTQINEMYHNQPNMPDCSACHLYYAQKLTNFANWNTSEAYIGNSSVATLSSLGMFHANYTATTCSNCHNNLAPATSSAAAALGATIPVHTTSFMSSSSGQLMDCNSCHTAVGLDWSVASGGTNHTATATNCATCHDTGKPSDGFAYTGITASQVVSQMNHNTVTGTDCYLCHRATALAQTPNAFTSWTLTEKSQFAGSYPSVIAVLTATGTYHSSSNPSSCASCHNNVAPIPGSNGYPSASNFPITDVKGVAKAVPDHSQSSYSGDCAGCHSAGSGLDWTNASVSGHTSTNTACAACHDSGKSSDGYAFNSVTSATVVAQMSHTGTTLPDCYACHRSQALSTNFSNSPVSSDGWVLPEKTQFSASTLTVISKLSSMGTFHAGIGTQPSTCAGCHTNLTPLPGKNGYPSTGWPIADINGSAGAVPDHTSFTGDCAGCHSSGSGLDWSNASISGHTSTQTNCASCHNATGADPTRYKSISSVLTGQMLHTVSGLPDCYACHRAQALNTNFKAAMPDGWVLPESATITNSYISVLSSMGSYHGNLTSQPTTCTGCHVGLEPLPGQNGYSATGWPLTDVKGNAGAVPDHTSFTGDCASCHNKGTGLDWTNASGTDHTATATDCATCHNTGSSYDGFAYNSVPATTLLAQMNHSAVALPDCYACHRTQSLAVNFAQTPIVSNGWVLPEKTTFTKAAPTADKTLSSMGTFHANIGTQPSTCVGCHSKDAPTAANGYTGTFPIADFNGKAAAVPDHSGSGFTGDCAGCHNTGTGLDWTKGLNTGHTAPYAQGCTICHGANGSYRNDIPTTTSTNCTSAGGAIWCTEPGAGAYNIGQTSNLNQNDQAFTNNNAPGGFDHGTAADSLGNTGSADCVACHVLTNVFANSVAAGNPTWVGTGFIDHTKWTGPTKGGGNNGSLASCSPCHGQHFNPSHHGSSSTNYSSCLNCHGYTAPLPSKTAPNFGGNDPGGC